MAHSDRILWLAHLLPVEAWRDALIVRHLERCPACAARLATREEARSVLVQAADVGALDGVWPAVRAAIERPAPRPESGPGTGVPAWRWAAAAAGFCLAAILTWTAVRAFHPGAGVSGFEVTSDSASAFEAAPAAGDVQLAYIRVDNEPARAIIYKPHDSNLVLIWAGRN